MYEDLIEVLENSIKKHGEKPLTNRWLLNMLKSAEKKETSRQFRYDPTEDELEW